MTCLCACDKFHRCIFLEAFAAAALDFFRAFLSHTYFPSPVHKQIKMQLTASFAINGVMMDGM